jgi:hypothetical protein
MKQADRQVQEQLKSLKPALSYQARFDSNEEGLGENEVLPLGNALQKRSEQIKKLLRRLDALNVRMDVAMDERERER